ncbi:oligo-1,6-glucosidase [Flavobacterium sp. CG_23.5]|uniref:glycoside hydrolase family 13 protein n=1 Tax=Flavobacterium sp. CG_23.5 TaxID=2760708 RepID=UPI001EBEB30D|nr:alpha-glucosidase [Flavobacterium sp. CG_23.5]MBP2284056.1 oligo-1,6-glucosidase [Flavobacterium sp. CG_23.5]
MKPKNILFVLPILFSCLLFKPAVAQEKKAPIEKKWWKEAVVYQIYPRSFKDSNGDGVGDIKGIISKLDYIKSLGIDVVWLNPIYGSPNADNGYDISDYQAIMKEFGTMEDFDALLKGMHQRGLKLVMDLVVNHSSDEHKWFQESRKSRDNPYRDYYHWWPAEKGKPAFRPGAFEADGSGWRYDKTTDSYYLHYFNYKQPDLNWENPKVRQEIYTMMNWWFKKGIDGFRMDVIPFIAKDTTFPVITKEELDSKYEGRWDVYFASNPNLHNYLQEMNKEVLSKYDVMSVAEGAGMLKSTALNFVDPERHELNMGYHFDGTNLGYVTGYFKKMNPNWSLVEFKKIYSDWDAVYDKKGWGTIYLGNHDQPRMTSRWGNDSPEFRDYSSKMLTTFLLSMKGTPYYYNGDEIGMTNAKFNKIEDYKDIETLAEYERLKNTGGNLKQFIEDQKTGGARDNGRTPFQWNDSKNGGFSTSEPWLKVNDNHVTLNAAAQDKDPNSVLNYFRKMVKLRKNNPVLIYGKYTLIDAKNPNIYAYTRELDGKKVLVMLNFRSKKAKLNTKINLKNAKLLIGNYTKSSNGLELKPYEAVVLAIK